MFPRCSCSCRFVVVDLCYGVRFITVGCGELRWGKPAARCTPPVHCRQTTCSRCFLIYLPLLHSSCLKVLAVTPNVLLRPLSLGSSFVWLASRMVALVSQLEMSEPPPQPWTELVFRRRQQVGFLSMSLSMGRSITREQMSLFEFTISMAFSGEEAFPLSLPALLIIISSIFASLFSPYTLGFR